jgi:alkylation response protein AidB-like acyl-CoA dehydrogenase
LRDKVVVGTPDMVIDRLYELRDELGLDGILHEINDGRPVERTLLFPKAAARISAVWDVLGLRGTGSDMYTVDELFVPEAHAIYPLLQWPDAPRRKLGMPYRFGASSLYAAGFAAVGLGNARAMLDAFIS